MRLAREPLRVFTTEGIAAEFAISRNHLTKMVRDLAEAGFVTTQRGANGGFILAMSPERIPIGDVVRRLEARQAIVECFRPDGGDCVLTPRCRLKGRLKRAADAFLREQDKTSLAECAYPGPPLDGRGKASSERRA